MNFKCTDNDGDGFCDSCKFNLYHTCNFAAGLKSIGGGSHKIMCSCGKFVVTACSDPDGDGKCKCGYTMSHVCDFAAGTSYLGDGKHGIMCSCGASIPFACSDGDGDGFCNSCGHSMY